MRMKIVIAVVAVIALIVVTYAVRAYYGTVDLGKRRVTVVIEQGDSFGGVADTLVRERVVKSRIMLKLAARLMNIDRKLAPGRYDFTGENSCRTVLDRFARVDFLKIKVTVPEGSPIWKTASILAAAMEFDSAAVRALERDSAFVAGLGVPGLEGYLYPETYYFPWGWTPEAVVAEMVELYHLQTAGIWPEAAPLGLSRREVIILASIIEAETKVDSERTVIASVYLNRLKQRMKLDADPTVIYGLGGLERPLYRKDLKKETPYNTYVLPGLPPTPINSPGLASIKAALNPDETDFLFFVADNNGGHYFSRTNAEHNRAKERIRSGSKGS